MQTFFHFVFRNCKLVRGELRKRVRVGNNVCVSGKYSCMMLKNEADKSKWKNRQGMQPRQMEDPIKCVCW